MKPEVRNMLQALRSAELEEVLEFVGGLLRSEEEAEVVRFMRARLATEGRFRL